MFSIKGIKIGESYKTFFIAEISANHGGSIKKVYQLVDLAIKSGASAIKLQTFSPDCMTINSEKKSFFVNDKISLWKGNNLYKLYSKNQTPWSWHIKIFNYAKKKKIIAFSSPFSVKAVKFLQTLKVPCYKIASFEVNHTPMLLEIAKTKKPIIMSTGMSTKKEIHEAIKTLNSYGRRKILLLKCTSSYPAEFKNLNLNTIMNMKNTFKCEVGFSDHSQGIEASVGAVALGASVIEKHIALDKKSVDGKFALISNNFKKMVDACNNVWLARGKIFYGVNSSERGSATRKRGICVVKKIKKDELFTEDNIRVIRYAKGLHPKFFYRILGKTSNNNLSPGSYLMKKMVKNLR
jgi:N-acetylneuraminate synthase